MVTMPAVMEHMHQRTRGQEQPGQYPENMGPVFGEQQENRYRSKTDKDPLPPRCRVATVLIAMGLQVFVVGLRVHGGSFPAVVLLREQNDYFDGASTAF